MPGNSVRYSEARPYKHRSNLGVETNAAPAHFLKMDFTLTH